jgi:hypothetical protein
LYYAARLRSILKDRILPTSPHPLPERAATASGHYLPPGEVVSPQHDPAAYAVAWVVRRYRVSPRLADILAAHAGLGGRAP